MAEDRPAFSEGSLARVTISLEGGLPRLSIELTVDEQAAIGHAHVQWAHLEHLIVEVTKGIASAIKVPVPADATQDSFRRRLAGLRSVLDQMAEHPDKKKILELTDRISNLNGFRQRLAHGLWSYNLSDADILNVDISKASGDGPRSRFDVDRIYMFIREVEEISFQLRYPDGKEQFFAERLKEGSGYSREAVKFYQGKPSIFDKPPYDGEEDSESR